MAWRQLARRSRRRVDRGTLQGESAIVPGFALLSLTRAQRGTNGRVCSGELWVERLTNDDGFEGCQQRRSANIEWLTSALPPVTTTNTALGRAVDRRGYPQSCPAEKHHSAGTRMSKTLLGLSRPLQVRLEVLDLSARNLRLVSDSGQRQAGESLKTAFNVTVKLGAVKSPANMQAEATPNPGKPLAKTSFDCTPSSLFELRPKFLQQEDKTIEKLNRRPLRRRHSQSSFDLRPRLSRNDLP